MVHVRSLDCRRNFQRHLSELFGSHLCAAVEATVIKNELDAQRQRTIGSSAWLDIPELLLVFSRLPADSVLLEVGVHGAAYGRIEVFDAEAFE